MTQAENHIVAVSNNKGGVAKTTTCFSLGACLAELGYRTLVVDLDPQADLTLSAGLDADDLDLSIADLLDPASASIRLQETQRAIRTTSLQKLDILPADPRLAGIERLLYEKKGYETALAKTLASWNERYQYILLDCPPSLGSLTLMALTAAHLALVPVQCEYYAARRLNRMLQVIAAVQQRTNPGLSYCLLATMYDQRNRICRGVLEQLQSRFEQLFEVVIGVDTRLRESPAVSEPVTLYAPRTRASRQYRQLARELDTRLRTRGV